MAILIEDITENEDQWLAQKRKTIGSGDIATIIGANRFCTPLRLWAIKTGREAPDPENDSMWFGKEMEPVIAKIASRKLGLNIKHANKLFGHDDIPWATATPDYFAWENHQSDSFILECKNVSWRMKRSWDGGAPLSYQSQVMWQCGVVGMKRGILAPLIGGDMENFESFSVEFDPRIFSQIVELAERFRWHVEQDTPPAPTSEDTKLVENLIGALEEKTASLPDTFVPEFQEYLAHKESEKGCRAAMDEAKKQADTIKNRIRLAMGNATMAKCGAYSVKATEVVKEPYMNKGSKYTLVTIKGGDHESE